MHVEPTAEDLRTRVRFPPPPPNKQATLRVAFCLVAMAWNHVACCLEPSEML